MGLRAFLSLIAALLSTLATAGEAGSDTYQVVRGPWWWHGSDGAPMVAVAASWKVILPVMPVTVTIDGRELTTNVTSAPLSGDPAGGNQILVLRLPVGTHGDVRWLVGDKPVRATVAPPPPRDAAVRLAITSAGTWLSRGDIEALAKHLGGRPQLVLALGPDCAQHLGSGDWEDSIPLAVVAPEDPALAAATAGMDSHWRFGLGFGVLGLPASPQRDRADLAMAHDLSPWLVYCDTPCGWDPAIGRRDGGKAADLGVLIAACQRLAVPLVLGGGRAGLVSEPLVLAPGGTVKVAPGGVRIALPVPVADDGLAVLSPEIALPLEQPLIAGLSADAGRLQLVLARPEAADALRLTWTHDPPGGAIDAPALAKRLIAAESLAKERADIATLLWLPRPVLAELNLPPELVARLRDEGVAESRALARRLMVAEAENPEIQNLPGEPDRLAVRDALLWRISSIHGRDALSWCEEAARSRDPRMLLLLFSELERDPSGDVMPALIRRVELQADGEIPLDDDPLDQHRLFAAVFDNVHLSPTELRPFALKLLDGDSAASAEGDRTPLEKLAVALIGDKDKAKAKDKDKITYKNTVQGFARGPIERFLARHGRTRAMPSGASPLRP